MARGQWEGRANAWSEQDTATLRKWYAERQHLDTMDLAGLASVLGRLKSNVCRKARELGLTNHKRVKLVKVQKNKYATIAESRAGISNGRKAWLAANGHPRGALGMRHTDAAKYLQSMRSREMHKMRSPKKAAEISDKVKQTNVAKYGMECPAGILAKKSGNSYSRCRGGKRADIDGMYFRSSWEANYARYLRWLLGRGEIASWEYEADTFRFEGVKRGPYTYMPDFKITELNGRVWYAEVKGWMDKSSAYRLKRMRKFFPLIEVRVVGEKEYTQLSKQCRGLIPGWEDKANPRLEITLEAREQ